MAGQTDFAIRFSSHAEELKRLYGSLYGDRGYGRLCAGLRDRWSQRPQSMRSLDTLRMSDPLWYQSPRMVGMMLYVDNFAGTFKEMPSKLDYLAELGITYIHLMPVCKMPATFNDGGYAVSDFTAIDERFGSDAQFDAFTDECHARGISICFDFVLNHTSDGHPWALAAKQGDRTCQNRYFTFPDRTMPDAYEKTVAQVFPVLAPGNFTFSPELDCWVLTTFNHFQWDLDYHNSDVFIDMADALMVMANRGVDMFRFDAIPYIWKEWGTSCRNLPQAHACVRLFRLVLEIAAPATIILGEVVMAPQEVAPYFGTPEAPECHLLYNVSFMVQLWNALATRDTRMLASSIAATPTHIPDGASWVNYVRSHDDIGWGLDEQVVRELGFDPFLHKRFLIDFYLGVFPGSFSKGALYESDPRTLDARNCGTSASLCGVEKALEEHDEYQLELAKKRILLLHTLCMAANGIPVVYSGDEVAQLNDYGYTGDSRKAHDSRFLHRGAFNWDTVRHVDDLSLPGSEVFQRMKKLIAIRKGQPMMGSGNRIWVVPTDDMGVLCLVVEPRKPLSVDEAMVVMANLTEYQKQVHIDTDAHPVLKEVDLWTDLSQGKRTPLSDASILLGPYESLLLVRKAACDG